MVKTITLNHITKIEGHAKLVLEIDRGKVKKCHLSSTEGSRYFEGIVKGRKYFEAHEMTSRICGICSSAHLVGALLAIEDALGVVPSEQTTQLRVLITLAERIRSHATHLYFLALPDYLGYESALAMAPKFKNQLKNALLLMKTGNMLISMLGSRDLHPVSMTVGGWLKLPKKDALLSAEKELQSCRKAADATCELFFGIKQPKFKTKGDWFSLIDKDKYPVLEGQFSSAKSSFEKDRYRDFIKEHHHDYSTANFVVKDDKRYMVGALPRLNNCAGLLSVNAKKQLKKSGLKLPSLNPFHNNFAQAIEIVHCIDHAIQICKTLTVKDEPLPNITVRSGRGIGVLEVPRGTLWHEYSLDDNGTITDANIITPTAQNLLNMQEDIREFLPSILHMKKDRIVIEIEKLIRSYDPCFSCSAHFLEVEGL